jgi:hypothetical protein
MNLQLSETKFGLEALGTLFEDLGTLMLKGFYSKIDTSCYIRGIYMTFLNKYLPSLTETVKSGSLVESVIAQGGTDRLSKGMISIVMKFFSFHCKLSF